MELTETTIYVCPMHPDVRQTEPGKCPRCGMDLVPEDECRGGKGPSNDRLLPLRHLAMALWLHHQPVLDLPHPWRPPGRPHCFLALVPGTH